MKGWGNSPFIFPELSAKLAPGALHQRIKLCTKQHLSSLPKAPYQEPHIWRGRKGSLWVAKEMAVAMPVKQARDSKHTQEITWAGHWGQSTARAELGEHHRAGQGNIRGMWKKELVPTESTWMEERAEMTEWVDKVIIFRCPTKIQYSLQHPSLIPQ